MDGGRRGKRIEAVKASLSAGTVGVLIRAAAGHCPTNPQHGSNAMRDYDEQDIDYDAPYFAALIVVLLVVVGWSVGCAAIGAVVWSAIGR